MLKRLLSKLLWATPLHGHIVRPKYVSSTYQRAMIPIFHEMLHECLEDYVDDIAVKSREFDQHADYLKKLFLRCKQYNLRMNPLKCIFSVSSG